MSCGIGCRHGSDSVLLWLWHRPAATAPLRSLAWELPYDAGAALKETKKKKKVLLEEIFGGGDFSCTVQLGLGGQLLLILKRKEGTAEMIVFEMLRRC